MNEYLHHVPGRMRIRARLFLSDSIERSRAIRRMRAIPGVRSLRLNEKAGSVTLYYDAGEISGEALLDALRRECPQATVPAAARGARRPSRMTTRPIAAEIGKMALGVLVNKGVSYSLASLLRAPI